MFKFILRKMLKAQMKNLPQQQQEMILKAFEKDPKFFQDMAKKIQEKVKNGANQQNAAMQVMMENRQKLQELMK